jgi:transposase-like protein
MRPGAWLVNIARGALLDAEAALAAGDGVDLVRELAQWALQQLIDTEATAVIGAERWERTATRTAERNGTRPRVLATATGDLHVGIPKLRKRTLYPTSLEPRRRIDQALHAVIMEAYVSGVPTRSVDDLVAAMGVASGVSKSQVSRICEDLDVRVDAFRNRTLGHVEFPYVFLDATYDVAALPRALRPQPAGHRTRGVDRDGRRRVQDRVRPDHS